MNIKQRQTDKTVRDILKHIGVEKDNPQRGKAYRAMKKMLNALTKTILWAEKQKRKVGIDFGEIKFDFSHSGVVRVILIADDEKSPITVLSEIRGA